MNRKKFVIIDGNAIIHRAYHAIPPLTTAEGTMVNAVYGFTSMLLKVIADLKPEYLAVSFDVSGPTFRDELYTEYKAKRVKADQSLYDQIPLVHEVVKAFNIPIFTKQGFEADDVIGTLATNIAETKEGIQTIIVTGDMDMLQLVDDAVVEVYLLKKGLSEFDLYNEKKVHERFGFGPSMVIDYKALRGDTPDNIPGVPGIGEKTAVELITKVGGIDDIYKRVKDAKKTENDLKPAVVKKLIEGEDKAYLSRKLATIDRAVTGLKFSLKESELHLPPRDALVELFHRFSFTSLLKRLPADGTNSASASNQPLDKLRVKKKRVPVVRVPKAEVAAVLKEIAKAPLLAVRELISGPDVLNGELAGLVFSNSVTTWYIPLADVSQKDAGALWSLFADEKKTLIGHDVKQLVKAIEWHVSQTKETVVQVTNTLFDLMIASYVLNSSTRAHDLPSIVFRELGKTLSETTEQTSLFGADPDAVGEEVQYFFALHKKYAAELAERNDTGLFDKIEMALIPILAEMELNGVAVDVGMLKKLSVDMNKAIEAVTKKIWKEAGEEFNVASSTQLRDILFEKMQIPSEGIKKGKTGFSTAASELEKLREGNPIIAFVEEHRELAKLQNTYVDVLPTLINKKTGRIHTTFNQAVAATGRLSSTDPNLQNIPIRTELGKKIRDAFVAEPGNVLVTADYSQIELRIVASLAEDTTMIDIFKNNKDIHTATAAAINGVSLEEVTKEMRYAAKEVNFGVLYGMGAYGLAWRAGIPQWQAKEFIEKYFTQFSGVKKYLDQTLAFAKKEGYVETLFGRRRYIPELLSDNYQLRNAGERMAINMPIQGTAADLMKMAMIAVSNELHEWKTDDTNDVRMIIQVHDELVLEVKKELADEVSELVQETMESVAQLRVPIEVHTAIGTRWGEMK